eukprot:TRINITY_DN2121_c0_g1_i2.p2 TRINITY_DN2121_c0_g1~~TRINITY_DN2121_c0_g1_i2.p2  ORF type:complete len:108 (-),score=35.82 TRINITY_DN2121_c0_g1_i2:224-547(-)
MPGIAAKLHAALAPGGFLYFRDYAQGDAKHVRLQQAPAERKLGPDFYARPDGTRAYFFSETFVTKLFTEAGFAVRQCQLMHITVVNHKEQLEMHRVWVQAVLEKPCP